MMRTLGFSAMVVYAVLVWGRVYRGVCVFPKRKGLEWWKAQLTPHNVVRVSRRSCYMGVPEAEI